MMIDQQVRYLKVEKLILWTENPRDPINENANEQEIVNRALEDKYSKWALTKLAGEMGSRYDFSELPTVVFHKGEPVVYDGNRRVILAKIKLGLVSAPDSLKSKAPDVPSEIPCNVCEEKVALDNIFRKHSDSGSWQPLERDIFLYKHLQKPKSTFLMFNDHTGIIDKNPHLNKRFVKEEIFDDKTLKSLGFEISEEGIKSKYGPDVAAIVFQDIASKVKKGEISTRKNRKDVLGALDSTTQHYVHMNQNNDLQKIDVSGAKFSLDDTKLQMDDVNEESKASETMNPSEAENEDSAQRMGKRTNLKNQPVFGAALYLETGDVNNLYRDILDLYSYYNQNKNDLSPTFPNIIRMALRLLCETAATGCTQTLDKFVIGNFEESKQLLTKDEKTTLSAQNVTKESIIQLLHTGAHNYTSASNLTQTIALSLIIGKMLTMTYGRNAK